MPSNGGSLEDRLQIATVQCLVRCGCGQSGSRQRHPQIIGESKHSVGFDTGETEIGEPAQRASEVLGQRLSH